MDYYMLSFINTHAAISARKLLEGVCPVQTMPVLRQVSAGCGIALRFAPEHLGVIRESLQSSFLPADSYSLYAVIEHGASIYVDRL